MANLTDLSTTAAAPTSQNSSAYFGDPTAGADISSGTGSSDPTLSDGSIQSDLENALFGGPISQTAPDLAAATSDTSSLSDSSQMGGMDYSFYSDPGSQPLPTYGYTDLSSGDPVQDFYSQLPALDLSQFDSSDSGAYVNPDGSISMP